MVSSSYQPPHRSPSPLVCNLTGALCSLNLLCIVVCLLFHLYYWPSLPLDVSHRFSVTFVTLTGLIAVGNLLIEERRDRIGAGSPSYFPLACGLAAAFAAAHYFTEHPKLSGLVALVAAEGVLLILLLALGRLLHRVRPTHHDWQEIRK
jgi:hypothetical protein